MILPIIVTTLSIICLLTVTSIKSAGKNYTLLSTAIGILVVHAAHGIFLEIENRNEDHIHLVSASFIVLYIPLFYFFPQVIFCKVRITNFAKLILALGLILAAYLYGTVTFRPSMPLYCYANLIWSGGCLAMVMLWQRLLLFTWENRQQIRGHENFKTVHLICFQIMLPFIVSFVYAVVSGLNIIHFDHPFFSIRTTVNLMEAFLWVIMIFHIYNIRKSYDVSHDRERISVTSLSEII